MCFEEAGTRPCSEICFRAWCWSPGANTSTLPGRPKRSRPDLQILKLSERLQLGFAYRNCQASKSRQMPDELIKIDEEDSEPNKVGRGEARCNFSTANDGGDEEDQKRRKG